MLGGDRAFERGDQARSRGLAFARETLKKLGEVLPVRQPPLPVAVAEQPRRDRLSPTPGRKCPAKARLRPETTIFGVALGSLSQLGRVIVKTNKFQRPFTMRPRRKRAPQRHGVRRTQHRTKHTVEFPGLSGLEDIRLPAIHAGDPHLLQRLSNELDFAFLAT